MIRSRYTFYSHFEPGVLLVYNSLRGMSSFLKFCGDDVSVALDCIDNPENHCGEKIHSILAEHGIIVPNENAENSICDYLSWKRIFSSRKLQYQIGQFFEIEFEKLGFLCRESRFTMSEAAR